MLSSPMFFKFLNISCFVDTFVSFKASDNDGSKLLKQQVNAPSFIFQLLLKSFFLFLKIINE